MFCSMWRRAVWKEGKQEEEGVVPDIWVKDDVLFWPPGVNAEKAMIDRREPNDKWRTSA